MRIVLLIGFDWAAPLILPVVSSSHKVEAIGVLVPKKYFKYIPLRIIDRWLFRIILFLKLHLDIKSNELYRTIRRFKVPLVVIESANSPWFIKWLKRKKTDLVLIAAWGEILNKEVIRVPRYGCINCHPSLLPNYRGPNPFYWVIFNGEKETGITFHYVDEGVDTGDIIFQDKVTIENTDTAGSLAEKCGRVAAKHIPDLLECVAAEQVKSYKQDAANIVYCANVKDGKLAFDKTAAEIYNRVQALSPWVRPYLIANGRKIFVAHPEIIRGNSEENTKRPGEIISLDKTGLLVKCLQDCVLFRKHKNS